MPVQLNIFLLLFGGLQGLLLSLLLITKKKYRGGYAFLILYILVMLLQILLKVISKMWLMENLLSLYSLSYRLPFLYGPLVYLLTVHLLDKEKKFQMAGMLHFAPFAVSVMVMFNYDWNHQDNFLTRIFFDAVTSTWMQLFSIITYHALAWRAWSIHSKAAKNRFSDISAVQARWVRNFVLASLAVCVVITLAIYFMFVHFPRLNNIRFLFVALTVFIYWISYSAMSQPAAFSIAEPVERTENIVASLSPRLVVHRSSRKYTNSGLHGEEMAAIQTTLQKIMSEQKPYLDPNLTINDLAARVQCNRHHLSQVLNESMRCSFYDFVNQYRVEEAKQLLLDSARENHKIASVAYDSGFNSLSTFNEVFKKMTGGTPSRFRKEVKDMPGQQAG